MSDMMRVVVTFGLMAFALLALFQVSKYTLYFADVGIDFWITAIAILFILFGIVLGQQLSRQAEVKNIENLGVHATVESKAPVDERRIHELGITPREHQVLRALAEGLSNREIAEKLYVSESTVKTHVSNLFSKLDARRRTQAVTIAKKERLID